MDERMDAEWMKRGLRMEEEGGRMEDGEGRMEDGGGRQRTELAH